MASRTKTADPAAARRPVERLRNFQLKVQAQLQNLQEQNSDLRSSLDAAKDVEAALSTEIDLLKNELGKLERDRAQLQESMVEAKKEHAAQAGGFERTIKDLQDQLGQLNREKAGLQGRLDSVTETSKQQIADLKSQLEQQQRQNKALQSSALALQESNDLQIYCLSRKAELLEIQNQTLQGSIYWRLARPVRRIVNAIRRRFNPEIDAGNQAQNIVQVELDLSREWGADSHLIGFDYDYYKTHYADVPDDRHTALLHYILHGERKGEWPNAVFDPAFYLQTYKDVQGSGMAALQHFLTYGLKEGRSPSALLHPITSHVDSGKETALSFLIKYAKAKRD